MTNASGGDRLNRIEALLEKSIVASDQRMTRLEQRLEETTRSSDERMTRLEQSMAQSDQRMTRLEQSIAQSDQRLTRIERLVKSNNRFLESFSADLKRYTESMNNLASRLDGIIFAANQDRQETNNRLAALQRQVAAIARHLGVM
jgi:chromosome segregation ATPase